MGTKCILRSRLAQSYWFNGLVPNAFILNDSRLKGDVQNFMNYVLAHQGSDGWIGPEPRYLWGRYVEIKGLSPGCNLTNSI